MKNRQNGGKNETGGEQGEWVHLTGHSPIGACVFGRHDTFLLYVCLSDMVRFWLASPAKRLLSFCASVAVAVACACRQAEHGMHI